MEAVARKAHGAGPHRRLPARRLLALTGLAVCFAVAAPAAASEPEQPIAWDYHITESHTADQIVFTFRGGTPGIRVGYVPAEHADASGLPIPLEGHAYLNLTFFPAHASVPGSPRLTPAERVATPRLAILRQIKPAGDFEGYVSFGLGLSRRVRFRITKVANSDGVVLTLRR